MSFIYVDIWQEYYNYNTYIHFMVTIVWYASNLHSKPQNTNNNENDYDVIKLAWTDDMADLKVG